MGTPKSDRNLSCKELVQLKPFRPVRDLDVLTILKAQAYVYGGDVDEGVTFDSPSALWIWCPIANTANTVVQLR